MWSGLSKSERKELIRDAIGIPLLFLFLAIDFVLVWVVMK